MDRDRAALDHLDDLWDRLVSGSAGSLHPQNGDAETIARLRASDDAEPDPVFARRLEDQLMNQAAQLTHRRLVSSVVVPARAMPPRVSAPPTRRFGHFSAAFLLLLALLTGYATYLFAAPRPEPTLPGAYLAASPATNCPVTLPNGVAADGAQASPLLYGNDGLSTLLWPEGIILMTPMDAAKPGGPYGMKFPWWRGAVGDLTITGHRLDGDAPPLTADVPSGYGKHGFQASGVWFPTPGCWEVTGHVGAASLTFVTLVVVAEEPVAAAMATPLVPASPVSACQATLPNGNVPPGAAPASEWHGASPLWTILWPTGVATVPAGLVLPDGAFVSTWDWWRGEPGTLTVEARRLDGPAPLLNAVVPDVYGDSGLQPAILFIPTAGCWQVTGRLNETALTVVMKVVAP